MTINIRNIDINYIQYGSGKDIVLLHGWGQNIEMMKFLGDELKNFRITILDLPGFGSSSEPTDILTIYDYVEILEEFLSKLEIESPIIIGHSFGGRIGIAYASNRNVEKLVLFGSPCIRNKKVSVKEKLLKSAKKLVPSGVADFAKRYIGSTDYKNASIVMRDILVQVVNEDLSDCAKKITCPTLLIWGTLDEAAPIEDARELEHILPDGALIELDGLTHYAYIEALPRVVSILDNFL